MKRLMTALLIASLSAVSVFSLSSLAQESVLNLPLIQTATQPQPGAEMLPEEMLPEEMLPEEMLPEEADAQPEPVPISYQQTYSELEALLSDTQRNLQPTDAPDSPIIFGAELMAANAHRGDDLLQPHVLDGNLRVVDELVALGVQGVTIQMTFPQFVPGFPRHQEYVDFYKELIAALHDRHLQVALLSCPMFNEWASPSVRVDYSQITEAEYWAQRQQAIDVMARELNPDYLILGTEPYTEAQTTGYQITPDDYLQFVEETLALLPDNGTLYGVGAGSWDGMAYFENFVRTDVDFIDIHIYPISNGTTNYVQRAAEIARFARAHGKRVTIGQFWLLKAAPSQIVMDLDTNLLMSWDPYSFWQPLDQEMLETVAMLAEQEEIEFVSPFFTKYLYQYLAYSPELDAWGPAARLAASEIAVAEWFLNRDGSPSETGLYYKQLITRYQE